tara:strand:+ start:1121 stop:1948 length:828 start_codon:yes stop_codon:yes gene_type:complete
MKKIALRVNPTDKRVDSFLKKIINDLNHFSIKPTLLNEDAENKNMYVEKKRYLQEDFDLLIVLGGDGTILNAGRMSAINQIPILGVSVGSFGFLTSTNVENFKETFKSVVENKYILENRPLLEGSLKGKRFLSVNDLVVSHEGHSSVSPFEIQINDSLLRYKGDGLVISTSTGSTAYNLSAGGPVVDPEMSCMLLTPICAHLIGVRPMIISKKSVSVSAIKDKKYSLSVDGQHAARFSNSDCLKVKVSDLFFKLIRSEDSAEFWTVVKEKFHWGN